MTVTNSEPPKYGMNTVGSRLQVSGIVSYEAPDTLMKITIIHLYSPPAARVFLFLSSCLFTLELHWVFNLLQLNEIQLRETHVAGNCLFHFSVTIHTVCNTLTYKLFQMLVICSTTSGITTEVATMNILISFVHSSAQRTLGISASVFIWKFN